MFIPADESLTSLVARAQQRDAGAWRELVRRLERLVWKAVNLATGDDQLRQDAFAATWLRLAEHLADIRDPERLPGWLSTVATNEVRSAARKQMRITAADPDLLDELGHHVDLRGHVASEPDAALLADELRSQVRRAFDRLDDTCRQVLTLLIVNDPPMSYAEAEAHLGRPHGSLGPTRMRCLEKLRRTPEIRRIEQEGALS